MMPETKLNVYQRLLEVRKTVDYLKKDADNQSFKYVSSSQTLASVRQSMNEQGLMLIPRVLDHEVRNHPTSKGANWYFTILTMEFTWVNVDTPADCVCCRWTGHGLDAGEKGVGKALTYAEKYFLLKLFNIPTDKDDPDAFEQKHEKVEKITKQQIKDAIKEVNKQTKLDGLEKVWNKYKALHSDKEFKESVTQIKANITNEKNDPEPAQPDPEKVIGEKSQEVIVKINANLLNLAKSESPNGDPDKNINERVDMLRMKYTGCNDTEGLAALKYKDLCIKHGNIKKQIAKVENQQPAAADVGDGQDDLPF